MTQHMGSQPSGQAHPTETAVARAAGAAGITRPATRQFVPPLVPAALEAVSLIDARAAAAVGSMSVSWWLQKVADNEAPQPAVRAPRCTRWTLPSVRAFWQAFGEQANASAAAAVKAQATKASAAAQAKRAAQAAQKDA